MLGCSPGLSRRCERAGPPRRNGRFQAYLGRLGPESGERSARRLRPDRPRDHRRPPPRCWAEGEALRDPTLEAFRPTRGKGARSRSPMRRPCFHVRSLRARRETQKSRVLRSVASPVAASWSALHPSVPGRSPGSLPAAARRPGAAHRESTGRSRGPRGRRAGVQHRSRLRSARRPDLLWWSLASGVHVVSLVFGIEFDELVEPLIEPNEVPGG